MATRTLSNRVANDHATRTGIVFLAACAITLVAEDVSFVPPSAEIGALWLPAGVGLALLLCGGGELWPALLLGTLAANMLHGSNVNASLALACAAAAEAYVGAYIVSLFANGTRLLARTRTFVIFIAAAGTASAVGPGLARILLDLLSDAPAFTTNASLIRWWIADLASALVVVPAVLAWRWPETPPVPQRRPVEQLLTVVALIVTWFVSFGGSLPADLAHAPLEVVCVPALLWTAYRFGLRPTSLAVACLSVVALQGTLGGAGPFAPTSHRAFMVALEAFVGVTAVTTFALTIVTGERRLAETELRRAAQTDALTGLANYGRLSAVLASESARAMRSGREFALLFVDLDGLKRINDTYGHLAGNAAICRVAHALRSTCREIDIVARIGGDEFCVLFPDSDENAAWYAAGRVARMLHASASEPRVTVSAGVAVYPRDGVTPESLIDAADVVLYGEKGRRHGAAGAPVYHQ